MSEQIEAIAAVRRLLTVAKRDTGQSEIVANFLLAWWNARTCGGFNLTDIWGVDRKIAEDMVRVFTLVAFVNEYPTAYGFRREFEELVISWRHSQSNKMSV